MRYAGIQTTALGAVLASVVASQSGCYSVYQPAASPRIQVRSDNVLLKNGKVVASLDEAVRADPVAEAEARRGSRARTTANVVYIGGLGTALAAEITGFALSNGKPAPPPAAIATLLVGGGVWLVTSIVGMGYFAKASRHEVNALNMYNDRLPPCGSPVGPAAR